jgi:hypothetical protein
MSVKVVYCKTEQVTTQTIVTKGVLDESAVPFCIRSEKETYVFDDLREVAIHWINPVGRMIRVRNGSDTLFFTVPRIFIDKGTGFVVINTVATTRACRRMKQEMERQHAQK